MSSQNKLPKNKDWFQKFEIVNEKIFLIIRNFISERFFSKIRSFQKLRIVVFVKKFLLEI